MGAVLAMYLNIHLIHFGLRRVWVREWVREDSTKCVGGCSGL